MNLSFNNNSTLQNLLNDAINSGIINLDEVSDRVYEMKNKKFLERHPYKISKNRDGRYSSYLPDETKPNNRRKIVKSSLEELEKTIIKYYKECDEQQEYKKICLRSLYPEWLNYKSLHTDSGGYIKTIDHLWIKFYLNDSIIDEPIQNLDRYKLDTWAHEKIKENRMTKKQYYNMAIIMRQALDLAVDKGIISENPFTKVKVNFKLFYSVPKKPDETQVFLIDEQPLIEKEAYKDFEKTNHTACLGIILAFQTGLRISELVGLKFSDINEEIEDCIHVQRMEVRDYHKNPDGTWSSPERIITERTKSLAGTRNVYLTSTAKMIIEKIKESNIQNGYDNSGYMFINKKGRMTSLCFNDRIRRYCRTVNISERGMHKIRKTFISTLIDADLNINYIRQQVGHVDERTTYGNYCFNRRPKDLTAVEVERALVHNF